VIASIETQLGGKALFDWRSEGLICRLMLPLAGEIATADLNDHQGAVAYDAIAENSRSAAS
jgi:hypothetical protein